MTTFWAKNPVIKMEKETDCETSSSSTSRSRSSSISTVCDTSSDVKKSESVSMDKLGKYRIQWWNQGNIHPMAEWDKVKLPYVLVKDVSIDKYEKRTDQFNVHARWEWEAKYKKNESVLGDVIIYEIPTIAHEVCVKAIGNEIMSQCRNVYRTNARIRNFGSMQTRAGGFSKEPDDSFGPSKRDADSPYGCDGGTKPWPNLILEVAFSESTSHVKDKVRNYWLCNNRAHDVIAVKIDYVSENQVPSRMKVWHYCVLGPYVQRVQRKLKPKNKFEFGTHDVNGNPLNYQQGTRVIRISLNCLYHDAKDGIQIPQSIPDPIEIDFFYVQQYILDCLSE